MGKRDGRSKTDNGAAFMRMKGGALEAAHDARIGAAGEYIAGAGVFAAADGGAALKPFLERLRQMLGRGCRKIAADAGCEGEENCAYLEGDGRDAYVKPADRGRMEGGGPGRAPASGRAWGVTGCGAPAQTIRGRRRRGAKPGRARAGVRGRRRHTPARNAPGVRFGKGARSQKRAGRRRRQKSRWPFGMPRRRGGGRAAGEPLDTGGGGARGGEGGLSFQAVYDPGEGRSEARAAAALFRPQCGQTASQDTTGAARNIAASVKRKSIPLRQV